MTKKIEKKKVKIWGKNRLVEDISGKKEKQEGEKMSKAVLFMHSRQSLLIIVWTTLWEMENCSLQTFHFVLIMEEQS